jgi:hypothetical protein
MAAIERFDASPASGEQRNVSLHNLADSGTIKRQLMGGRMSIRSSIVVTALAAAGLAGCGKPATPPSPPPAQASVFGLHVNLLNPCTGTYNTGKVFKIIIDDKLDIRKLDRKTQVKSHAANNKGDDEESDGKPDDDVNQPNPYGSPTTTAWDIDPSLYSTTDSALVKVIIADGSKNLSFRKNVENPTDPDHRADYWITSGDSGGDRILCGPVKVDPKNQFVVFRLQYIKGGPKYGTYNIGLELKDGGFSTPIYIDPNVKNNG